MSEAPPHTSRKRRILTIASEIGGALTVIAILIPAVVWAVHHVWPQPTTPPTASSSPATGSVGAGPATDPTADRSGAPGGQQFSLVQLPPDTGATNLGQLPRQLAGQAGYDNAVVIPCASNQAADQSRSVTYVLAGRYTRLHATLHPFEPVPDESRVQFQVFLDDQPPATQNVQVNKTGTLDLDVYGRRKMQLRVTCESPDATAILTNANLVHIP